MNFSNEVLMVIYGVDANITELRKIKDTKTIWNDIVLFLAKDDVTKIEEVRNMQLTQVLDILESKVKALKLPKVNTEQPRTKIGYK